MSAGGASSRRLLRRIGGYYVFEELARDEVGVIHLATTDGETWAALKLLHRDLAADAPMRAAFLDAMRAAERITDDHVSRVLGSGTTEEGVTWAALESLDGERVEMLLTRLAGQADPARRRVPWSCAVAIVANAARGLAAVHAAKDAYGRPLKLHGQIAPRNIFVTYGGRVKILEPVGPQLAGRRLPDPLTESYRAPEQVLAEAVDGRADIFALGLVLWELTAGRRLERRGGKESAADPFAVPALPSGGAPVPATVQEVLKRATARRPANRYASVAAMAADLERVLVGGIRAANERELARYMDTLFADRVERHLRFRERARERLKALSVRLPSFEEADADATARRRSLPARVPTEMPDLFDLGEEIEMSSGGTDDAPPPPKPASFAATSVRSGDAAASGGEPVQARSTPTWVIVLLIVAVVVFLTAVAAALVRRFT